jgi:hypothetical protein
MDLGLSGEEELEGLDDQDELVEVAGMSEETLWKTEGSENFSAMPSRLHR